MFLQSCFIYRNTESLRGKLDRLGYNCRHKFNSDMIWIEGNNYFCSNQSFLINKNIGDFVDNRICCGTNEYLFHAIAALRNDTDKYQWFVNKEGEFFKCFTNEFIHFAFDPDIFGVLSNPMDIRESPCPNESPIEPYDDTENWHKATVEELINKFKDK